MKKLFLISLTMIFFLSFSAASVLAGSKQRHQWQGAAIAVGAAIVGNAILNSCQYDSPRQAVATVDCYRPYRSRHNSYCSPPRNRGHWECKKIWVEPVCERVWNPGHYNEYGQWVPGQYIMIERKPGYWKQERAWMGCR